jgi:DNA polymerase-3 subunit alpha
MKAVIVLGGFSPIESDGFRTNMKKFQLDVMKKSEEKFIAGAVERGCSKHEAMTIWNKLLAFGKYGFNRSHSTAYGIIAYWTQWLKANYPLEFWTTSLQYAKSEMQVVHRISEMNKICKDIELKPPSVNISTNSFECNKDNNSIYWSLNSIKGIGESVVKFIIEKRAEHGYFKSYNDFIFKVPKKNVNKATLTALILSGAFDEIEMLSSPKKRRDLLERHLIRNNEVLPDKYNTPEAGKDYFWIIIQKALTGYGEINYYQMLVNLGKKSLSRMYVSPDKFVKSPDYSDVCICGILTYTNERVTKAGKNYCVLEIVCNNDIIIVTLWEETMKKYIDLIRESTNKIIAVTGKVKFDDYKGQNVLYSTDDSTLVKL